MKYRRSEHNNIVTYALSFGAESAQTITRPSDPIWFRLPGLRHWRSVYFHSSRVVSRQGPPALYLQRTLGRGWGISFTGQRFHLILHYLRSTKQRTHHERD